LSKYKQKGLWKKEKKFKEITPRFEEALSYLAL